MKLTTLVETIDSHTAPAAVSNAHRRSIIDEIEVLEQIKQMLVARINHSQIQWDAAVARDNEIKTDEKEAAKSKKEIAYLDRIFMGMTRQYMSACRTQTRLYKKLDAIDNPKPVKKPKSTETDHAGEPSHDGPITLETLPKDWLQTLSNRELIFAFSLIAEAKKAGEALPYLGKRQDWERQAQIRGLSPDVLPPRPIPVEAQ